MTRIAESINGLAEVVLRVNNLDAMQKFYEETLGFEVARRFGDDMVFLKIAIGPKDMNQFLALFRAEIAPDHGLLTYDGLNSKQTTLHHFAFGISWEDYDATKHRLEQLGLDVRTAEHEWMNARSLYIPDPEGNVVEFIANRV